MLRGLPAAADRSIPFAIISAATLAMLTWTWQTWPDPLIDFGRELYLPWRIVNGQALYVDVASFNGPLSPYLNALWFRLLGVSMRTLFAANFILLCLLLYLLFQVFSTIGSRLSATVACLTFVALFGFGELSDVGNYNFMAPYSHELTHGIILSFGAIWLLTRHARSGSASSLVGIGVLLGLVFLTKPEVFVAAAPALAIGVALSGRSVRPESRWGALNLIGLVGFGFVIVWAAAVSALALAMPPQRAFLATLGAWRYALNADLGSLVFYQRMAGLDHPAASLRAMAYGAVAYVALLSPIALVAYVVERRRGTAEVAAALCLAAASFFVVGRFARLGELARPFPLFLVGLTAWHIRSEWRATDQHHEGREEPAKVALLLFSLLLLAKMILNARIYQYGFALAMPATLVMVVSLTDWAPQWLTRHGGSGTFFRAAVLVICAVVAGLHLAVVRQRLAEHRIAVGSGADRFVADGRGVVVNEALSTIARTVSPRHTLAVLPEGAMLNYLSRRPSSSPYLTFLPPDTVTFGEDRMVASFELQPPDFVAIVDVPTREYGVATFGEDYDRLLNGSIGRRYRPVATIPGSSQHGGRFGVTLFRLGAPDAN